MKVVHDVRDNNPVTLPLSMPTLSKTRALLSWWEGGGGWWWWYFRVFLVCTISFCFFSQPWWTEWFCFIKCHSPQPTELIWGFLFLFHKFPSFYSPPPPSRLPGGKFSLPFSIEPSGWVGAVELSSERGGEPLWACLKMGCLFKKTSVVAKIHLLLV